VEIIFKKFTKSYLPLYYKWAEKEHVKDEWFREGYKPVDDILNKLDSNSDAFPFIIQIDDKSVGFIQYYYALRSVVGFDIFIGEEDFLEKGYGTKIVHKFTEMLFALAGVNKIIVDPFVTNKKAQACYKKAGFTFVRTTKDTQGTEIYIMELRK
jgi:RimJ/RimL family protein N-acetyltransferase